MSKSVRESKKVKQRKRNKPKAESSEWSAGAGVQNLGINISTLIPSSVGQETDDLPKKIEIFWLHFTSKFMVYWLFQRGAGT